MQQPDHVLTQPAARWTNERIVGVGFVGILHVIAITAILAGLSPTITRIIAERPIDLIRVKTDPPVKPIVTPRVKDNELPRLKETVVVPNPVVNIEPEKAGPVQGGEKATSPQPPVPDTYASGVSNTHTIPAYPPLARRLGEQGGVRLSLTISASGDVTGASVVQSSGYPDLDQTAVEWVMSHWRYKPATHGGVAVPSQTLAMVVFNLQNAR